MTRPPSLITRAVQESRGALHCRRGKRTRSASWTTTPTCKSAGAANRRRSRLLLRRHVFSVFTDTSRSRTSAIRFAPRQRARDERSAPGRPTQASLVLPDGSYGHLVRLIARSLPGGGHPVPQQVHEQMIYNNVRAWQSYDTDCMWVLSGFGTEGIDMHVIRPERRNRLADAELVLHHAISPHFPPRTGPNRWGRDDGRECAVNAQVTV